jgi:FkbM family methyltransferase
LVEQKSNNNYSLINDFEIITELGNFVASYGTQAFNYLIQEAGTNRDSALFKALAKNSRDFLNAFENFNYNPLSNGEYFVLQTLTNFWNQLPQVYLFDVGANQGTWSLMANNLFPNAIIHCFEIAPHTFQKLKQNTQQFTNILINESGLSEIEEDLQIRYFPEADTLTTITTYPHDFKSEMMIGHVIKGDDYTKKNYT